MARVIVLLLLPTLALAAVPSEPELFAALLARMDADGDGQLRRAEYTPFDGSSTFDDIDANRDASISASELGAWVKVTQPRPLDRPPRTIAAIASGEGAPSFASLPMGPPTSASPTSASGGAGGLPSSADGSTTSRWLTRTLVLGTMTIFAGAAAWRLLRTPKRRRR